MWFKKITKFINTNLCYFIISLNIGNLLIFDKNQLVCSLVFGRYSIYIFPSSCALQVLHFIINNAKWEETITIMMYLIEGESISWLIGSHTKKYKIEMWIKKLNANLETLTYSATIICFCV